MPLLRQPYRVVDIEHEFVLNGVFTPCKKLYVFPKYRLENALDKPDDLEAVEKLTLAKNAEEAMAALGIVFDEDTAESDMAKQYPSFRTKFHVQIIIRLLQCVGGRSTVPGISFIQESGSSLF